MATLVSVNQLSEASTKAALSFFRQLSESLHLFPQSNSHKLLIPTLFEILSTQIGTSFEVTALSNIRSLLKHSPQFVSPFCQLVLSQLQSSTNNDRICAALLCFGNLFELKIFPNQNLKSVRARLFCILTRCPLANKDLFQNGMNALSLIQTESGKCGEYLFEETIQFLLFVLNDPAAPLQETHKVLMSCLENTNFDLNFLIVLVHQSTLLWVFFDLLLNSFFAQQNSSTTQRN